MIDSLKNYIASKDWRIVVIEVVSLVLAILSASLLESKFFQIFISDQFYAAAFAIVVVFAVTFVAYVVADNLQANHKNGIGRIFMIAILSLCYGAVLIALLGMSNYTMTVLKASKDIDVIESKVISVDNLPAVKFAKEELIKTELDCKKETNRIQEEIGALIEREQTTGWTYVTKKQEYEKLKEKQRARFDKAKDKFAAIRDREEARVTEQSKTIATAGKVNGGLGKLLAHNPAILPVLALVILFIGRLSFSAHLAQMPIMASTISGVTLTTTKTTHSASITLWSHDRAGWIKAISALARERNLGNGTGMLTEIAEHFNVNKGSVSRALNRAQLGKPINVPKKLMAGQGDSRSPLSPVEIDTV